MRNRTETFHTDNKVDSVPNTILTPQYELDTIELGFIAAIWLTTDRPDVRAMIDLRDANEPD